MRIGIVLSNTPGYSETFFNSKIKGLQENGMEVYLFCQSRNAHFSLCPLILSPKISRNPLLQLGYFIKEFALLLPHFLTIIRFIKLERKEDYSLLQIFKKIYLNSHLLRAKLDWLHFGFATMALGRETVARAIGAKMAVSLRGFDIAVYPVKNPNCYKMLWKYVDKVHTISNDLLVLAKEHGLPENKSIQKITPAINIDFFQTTQNCLNNNDKLVFVTTGRLHWKKGFVPTIEALAILKNKGLNFTYKIIGDGKEYERIAFAAYQLGLKDNVQFLGKLSNQEVKEQLENCSIYLQYSLQEGFCNAVLEAQAMGKLCVVSNAEGLAENVVDEKTGWVVPKYSSAALGEAIQNVLALNESEKEIISRNATERVKKNFNLTKQREQFLSFYNEF